ncbi:MAG: replication and repair protein RecF [Actinomycetota bacterium]
MIIQHLELTNFRNYAATTIDLTSGVTAVVGNNGQGKTNLVEALGYLATLKSFRGVPTEALIRTGCESAVLRATVVHADGREVLIETELVRTGRNRSLVNKQRLARSRDLLGVVRTTVFSPEDLELVKAAPSVRRDFVDDALVALQPKLDVLCSEIEKVLRQRNSLLKQAGGRLSPDIASTLDVWDAKLAELGNELGDERSRLIAQISPRVSKAYEELAEKATPIGLVYEPEWRRIGLANELQTCRMDDIRRGTSTVGPHRDDIDLLINGLPARTHASQGEQRTLALAMRLAVHRMVTEEFGSPPVLILDDVLSELDPGRAAALLRHFPEGQVLITTAGYLPEAAHPDRIVRIQQGAVVQDSTTKDSFPT